MHSIIYSSIIYTLIILTTFSCSRKQDQYVNKHDIRNAPYLKVLGTIQDAGSPHIGCDKICCLDIENPDERKVVSLGLIDPISNEYWIFEASPDFPAQNRLARNELDSADKVPTGIFLTHAHIGHYTGLMYLGREAIGARNVPVFVMPRMDSFLRSDGPWSQLVKLKNIDLRRIEGDSVVQLNERLKVIPLRVPHRDEYSETVGYKIIGPNKSILFIPDINKWSVWDQSIIDEVSKVDAAFLDATFYDQHELPGRSMEEIPHPFVLETMMLFENEPDSIKGRIQFIHLNHSNPLLRNDSLRMDLVQRGFNLAQFEQEIAL